MFAVESLLGLPANVTKAQETKVLTSLEAQVQKLEGNVAAITKMDKAEHTKKAEEEQKQLRSSMKKSDQVMLDKMDEWGKRMNRKTRLGAMDVIGKRMNRKTRLG